MVRQRVLRSERAARDGSGESAAVARARSRHSRVQGTTSPCQQRRHARGDGGVVCPVLRKDRGGTCLGCLLRRRGGSEGAEGRCEGFKVRQRRIGRDPRCWGLAANEKCRPFTNVPELHPLMTQGLKHAAQGTQARNRYLGHVRRRYAEATDGGDEGKSFCMMRPGDVGDPCDGVDCSRRRSDRRGRHWLVPWQRPHGAT